MLLIEVGEFRDRVRRGMDGLVKTLQAKTGRKTQEEERAWRSSLPMLADAFEGKEFQKLHFFFSGKGVVGLEYNLPSMPSWCDVVVLGKKDHSPSVMIVELKDWDTTGDGPGRAEGLIYRRGVQELHPSDQVRGYVEYCRNFHSAVDPKTLVNGCVFLTGSMIATRYGDPPNGSLVSSYPIFTRAPSDLAARWPEYFGEWLSEPDVAFAQEFADGVYRQNRSFVETIAKQVIHPESRQFILLDNQRRAFQYALSVVNDQIGKKTASEGKTVVVINGPPGAGKSAIAAQLWATLVSSMPAGDIVLTTTSGSQSTAWRGIFQQVHRGARHLLRNAASFFPLTLNGLRGVRKAAGIRGIDGEGGWRANLAALRRAGISPQSGAGDNAVLVSIVDEAHALINPEHPAGRGMSGFPIDLGPQAYHIMRSSRITIFLLDAEQGFRTKENTTAEDIRNWAKELGVETVESVDLDKVQFRCGGSVEFVTWLEALLTGEMSEESNQVLASAWYRRRSFSSAYTNRALAKAVGDSRTVELLSAATMGFEVFASPSEMEVALRQKLAMDKAATARIVSSYSRKWVTGRENSPHELPDDAKDFYEADPLIGTGRWSRVWNVIPKGDYAGWVLGTNVSRIALDPLCEVGCPYVVRGFDYDYVGVLWLDDLLWREGHWVVNTNAVHETGFAGLMGPARAGDRSARDDVLRRVKQAYRILFTRAMRGVFVCCPDKETRDHIMASVIEREPDRE
jgi:DUF2075 family protein